MNIAQYPRIDLTGISPGQFSLEQLESALDAGQPGRLGLTYDQNEVLVTAHTYHHSILMALQAGRLDDALQYLQQAGDERVLGAILNHIACTDAVCEYIVANR